MIAYLRDYYAADGMRGVRALASRAVRDHTGGQRAEDRRVPEDREWHPTGEPLAFAIDGRDFWDDAYGPGWARSQPVPIGAGWMAARHRRWLYQVEGEARFRALDRIAQRMHIRPEEDPCPT